MADLQEFVARVRELFHYDQETGAFIRKVRLAQCHHVGDRADMVVAKGEMAGYRRVCFDSKKYLAHRLAWLYVHGAWPSPVLDHHNGDRGDNRLVNLRDGADGVNQQNQRQPRKDNKLGLLGVFLHSDGVRYRAKISVNGRSKHIGLFATAESAHAAYLDAKRRMHEGCTI